MKKVIYMFLAAATVFAGCENGASNKKSEYAPETDAQLVSTAKDAYIYGFPLILSEISQKYAGAVSGEYAANRIINMPAFADDSFKMSVKPAPFVFTSFAWLDLSSEPFVFEMPEIKGRYAFLSVSDAWRNDIFSTAAFGAPARKIAVAGPAWSGIAPDGAELYRSRTNTVFLSLQIEVKNTQDAAAAKKIQSLLKLYPLSFYGRQYKAQALKREDSSYQKHPLEQVFAMGADEYFNLLNKLTVSNLPSEFDSAALDGFLDIGLAPGMRFDMSLFSEDLKAAFDKIASQAKERLQNDVFASLKEGWLFFENLGNFKSDYSSRAKAAFSGFSRFNGAFCAEAYADAEGEKLDGSKNGYVLHFDKDAVPSEESFWSVAVYGADGFFVKNKINRFAFGSASGSAPAPKLNKDGSMDIYVRFSDPGKDKNWLPCPRGVFTVVFRYALIFDSGAGRMLLPAVNKEVK
ncbi:MAG: DUF1214 domain-containing protein [Endomicrobia bacterium]|nr:DUF1214 domain-containing protein [Endomicrobiia bacterium]